LTVVVMYWKKLVTLHEHVWGVWRQRKDFDALRCWSLLQVLEKAKAQGSGPSDPGSRVFSGRGSLRDQKLSVRTDRRPQRGPRGMVKGIRGEPRPRHWKEWGVHTIRALRGVRGKGGPLGRNASREGVLSGIRRGN